MGEYAESTVDCVNSVHDVPADMPVARDIARRFEQLESQWQHFQKKSAKWEVDDSSGSKADGILRNRLQSQIVPSTGFSYSNPLFTTNKPEEKKATNSPLSSLTPGRSALSLLTSFTPDRIFASRPRQPLLSSSEKRGAIKKEGSFLNKALPAADQTTSCSSPSSSLCFKETTSYTKKFHSFTESSKVNGNPTLPTSSSSSDKTRSYSSSLNCESLSKPSSSSSPVSSINLDRQTRDSSLEASCGRFDQGDSEQPCQAKLPICEYTGKVWSSPLRFPKTSTDSKLADLGPASYSYDNGTPGLHITSATQELRSIEVAQSSRSPPPVTPSASSALEANLHSDCSTMEPHLNVRGKQPRYQPWETPVEGRILSSDGTAILNSFSSQMTLEEKRSSPDSNVNSDVMKIVPALSVKTSRVDTQEDWNDRTEMCSLMQKKLDHTVSKVEWELRLSKREAKLRSAEEALLEEQQKLSEARLALSVCEAVLSQREEAVKQLEQIRDVESACEAVETGSVVIEKLVEALRDVLLQMEQNDKGIRDLWTEVKHSFQSESGSLSHRFGFEPEQSRALLTGTDLEGITFLTAGGDCKEWCKIVINVCERLVAFLSHEGHVQKWAMVLEKESARLKILEDEMVNTKEATSEHFERAAEMMRCAEEQCRVAEEGKATLNKERDSLVQWVTHLQKRRKTLRWKQAVTECEREAASSLAEVHKKAANLFVHESTIDGKALELSSLQEELWAASQRLHDDQELVNKDRVKVQERFRQVSSRERDVESQLQLVRKLKEELDEQKEKFEKERTGEERKREKVQLAQRDLEDQLNLREMTLRDIEKELEEKALAAESLANQLNEREKILKSMHDHCEHERLKAKELIADLEKEKKRMQESEDAIGEAQLAKRNADEAWARVARERREADDYLNSVEERVKAWEDRLRGKEKELQQQQLSLREIENRIQEEQYRSQSLHAKLTQEQENWTEELKAKQESLAKKTKSLENKELEIKGDLEKLTEERRLAINEIKRFGEIEAREWNAERELQAKQDEHLQLVRKHAKEYRVQIEELEVARREVEREFEEVNTRREELQVWQREAEETLQTRIDSFKKGKEELQMQIQELKKLQLDIEQAGAQIIDRVTELDKASSKLEVLRSRVESSKKKLAGLAKNLAQQQELVKDRESSLNVQEENVTSALSDIKRMDAEIAAKEKCLRYREQAVIDSEHDLKELEARLANERKDLEKMIAEVEQHAATLKEETACAEESSRNRSREELLVEEKRQYILAREKELAAYETELKNKALSLEEHSQMIAKLDLQVQERLQKAQDVGKDWEKLKEEKAAFELERQKTAVQKEESQNWKAEQDRQAREDAQRKARLREELDRQKTEMLSKLRDREANFQVREARIAEKEAYVQVLERQSKEQVHKDAQEFRQQLTGARAELESQRHYVEEKRRTAQAIAATIGDREAKLKAREKEVQMLELSLQEREGKLISFGAEQREDLRCLAKDSQIHTLEFFKMHEEQDGHNSLRNSDDKAGLSFQDNSLYRMANFDLMGSLQDMSSKELPAIDEEKRNGLRTQEDELATQRLKQMEEALRKEASKIMQEKSNLKLQQKELEETRKAVQDVKVTLTAQLKATKQMVADAALTARNASREREALEEERRKLESAQNEAQTSLSVKVSKLHQETRQLEHMRNALLQEKAQAMELLHKAALVVDKERDKIIETKSTQKVKNSGNEYTEREKDFNKNAEALHKEKLNLQDEKARLKMLHEVLERGKQEQSHIAFQQGVTAAVQKEAENRIWNGVNKWRGQNKLPEVHNYYNHLDTQNRDGNGGAQQDFAIPSCREAVESPSLGNSQTSSRVIFTPSPPERMDQDGTNPTNTSWDETVGGCMLLSSPGSSVGVKVHETALRKRRVDNIDRAHDENTPSKKRLENVMTSLINARQASRSRLQRTENALLGFPPSSPFTSQVQQALNALSSRLGLMEQIEDGLASHLRKAYEMEYPESEGVIVDKVQLLCRMEEQQSLRAEWEEDMQQQLETISMLQAASRNACNFTTPVKGANLQDSTSKPWPSAEALSVKSLGPQDAGLTTMNGGSSGPNRSRHYPSPEWRTTFEPLLGVDSKGLSFSPLVDYHYHSSSGHKSHSEYAARENVNSDKFVRRKLHLPPSTNAQYGIQ